MRGWCNGISGTLIRLCQSPSPENWRGVVLLPVGRENLFYVCSRLSGAGASLPGLHRKPPTALGCKLACQDLGCHPRRNRRKRSNDCDSNWCKLYMMWCGDVDFGGEEILNYIEIMMMITIKIVIKTATHAGMHTKGIIINNTNVFKTTYKLSPIYQM